jgi:hypothetical protein
MKHMSSTTFEVHGSISLTHMPDLPCCLNWYFDGAIGLPDGTFMPIYNASGATVGVDYNGIGS